MSSKQDNAGMKSTAKRKLVPRLRFPEFRDAGGWEEATIGDIGSFYYGKSAPKWSLEENAPTRCVRYGELYTKFGATITETYSRTNIDPKNLRFSKGGEILVPRVGEKPEDFGKCCCYLPLENIAIGEMISVFETAQNPLFYTYYFRSLYKQFAKVVEGQNVKNLYYVELEPLPICRPLLPEQKKIAECLASIDDRITAEAQKLEALREHKKGLMHQLFPAEGQTLPQLRFPEFHNAGEWKSNTLENLCTAKISYGIVQAGPHVPNGMPYIKSTDLNSGLCLASLARTSDVIAQKYRKSEVVPGDLVFSLRGNIGAAQIVPKDIPVANLTQGTARIRTQGPPEFYLQALRSQPVHSQILAVSKGSTFKEISLEALRKIRLFHPEIDEQQRIADCLSSLDELIALQAQKIDTLKLHKKGLMQQLFPSVDEVNG